MDELIAAARRAQAHAYAPYSGYRVGAAVLDAQGRVHAGCNVENVSYPVGSCAERGAIAAMVAEGGTEIRSVAVVTKDGGTPCGMCLQAIAEFAKDPTKTEIITVSEAGEPMRCTLADLLPQAFSSSDVGHK